jgi:prepilin-type N-terminal cleavage/methylation domain-containing protein
MARYRGLSLVELLVALVLIGILTSVLLPTGAEMVADARAAAGAREMAATLQALRWKAVSANRSYGLFFSLDQRGWHWLVVRDGNGNGLRTAEVRSGTDPAVSGPHRMEDRVDGLYLGFPPVQSLPAIPPRSGSISNLADPVKFGNSNLISFSPWGTASSGTLYLTDRRHALRAVVLFGPTVRVRVWRFDTREARWKL